MILPFVTAITQIAEASVLDAQGSDLSGAAFEEQVRAPQRRAARGVFTNLSEESLRRFQVQKALLHAAIGFLSGLIVLHPLSMAVFGWLGIGPVDGSFPLGMEFLWKSYTVHVVPMGVVFGLFGVVVGGMDGYYRSAVHFRRDELARLLVLKEQFRGELEVQNERLHELEAAKRRSTRFLVHDLRNHLGCVLGFTDVLLKRAAREQREDDRKDLERIGRQGRQMLGAVVDLLDIARLEEAPGLDLAWVQVPSLLAEALESVDAPGVDGMAQVGERSHKCPPVRCDRKILVRVLANLVTNAIKHTHDGVAVTLDAEPADGEVVFSCHDGGTGIPIGLVPRLFGEFVMESEHARGDSSGLGLAFCKAAVEAHGGRIWCESGSGRGTTFYFTLPLNLEATQ